jgi:hypothetical protein
MDATSNGPQEFVEYAYFIEWPDGSRSFEGRLASAPWQSRQAEFERECAFGQFRAIQHDAPGTRYVLGSRRVTYTPWTDEETT